MLPGPVFNVELVTTARRARYFALRFFYGAILLAVVWQNDPVHYSWYYGTVPSQMTLEQAAELGEWLFRSFAVTQSIAVLLITPALVGAVIAEEKQRKTLHYLLASRLSSPEIVLGKLCARLLHVGVLLGVGLPVLSLLGLFGGVQPELVVLTFVATLTAVFFVASFAMLISVYARRSRDAIAMVYVVELAWLSLPVVVAEALPAGGWPWVQIYEWLRPVNDLIGSSSPLYVLTRPSTWARASWGPFNAYAWMVGLQAGGAVLFLALAVARLRPVFRSQGDTSRWAGRISALKHGRRLLPRPACGDDAMLWKERYVSRTSLATKVIGGVVAVVLGGVVAYSAYQLAVPAFKEVYEYGYGSVTEHNARDWLNAFVRSVGGFAYLVWVLGVASAASSGIASEREGDTWTSLIVTPLEPTEIIRAKILGAVWGTRWIGFLLLAVATLGLAGGAVHPVGYAGIVVETVVFIWFAAALGTYVSLRSKNSGRAMTATMGILVLLNGGYLLCCIPLRPNTVFIVAGVTPALEVLSFAAYDDVHYVLGSTSVAIRQSIEAFMACVVGTFAYGVAALVLSAASIGQFDEVAERPRRYGQYPPFRPLKEALVEEDAGIEFLDE
ncbi:MAG: ABC transporter permease [Isosphaeraceae bacterium]|nr:ABC transporter permease [Isosphaeraceae bacterium]